MTEANPSIMSHVSIGTNDVARSLAFYDRVLATLGARRIMEHPGAIAYGKVFPEFWVQTPIDGGSATIGNGVHFGFLAETKAEVDAFYAAAVAAGGTPEGEPGPRPHYGEGYYGCFVRDPDGHKVEACYYDLSTLG